MNIADSCVLDLLLKQSSHSEALPNRSATTTREQGSTLVDMQASQMPEQRYVLFHSKFWGDASVLSII